MTVQALEMTEIKSGHIISLLSERLLVKICSAVHVFFLVSVYTGGRGKERCFY